MWQKWFGKLVFAVFFLDIEEMAGIGDTLGCPSNSPLTRRPEGRSWASKEILSSLLC